MTRNLTWLALCFACSLTTALVVRHWDSLTVVAQECVAGEDCEDCVPSVSDGQGGWAPLPIKNGDIDANSEINLTDAVYLLNYLFMGGPEPPEIECVQCLEPGEKACVRFLNQLYCGETAFTGELDVCGTKLTSVSGELSDCLCIDPVDACAVCIDADGGACGPIEGCGPPMTLEAGKVYTFILDLNNDGAPSLGFIDQDGDCDTPLPDGGGGQVKRLGAQQAIMVLEGVEGLEAR